MRVKIGKHTLSFSISAVKAYKDKKTFVSVMKKAYEGKIEGDIEKQFGDAYDLMCPSASKKSK